MIDLKEFAWPVRGFARGADWNPDQWPREVWQRDIELMVAAGVNLVTLPVFAWASLEPSEGQFDFGWLDEILDAVAAAGIGVDLATGTATPPAWLVRKHPDALPVNQQGTRLDYGSRQSYCPSSEAFRSGTRRLVTAMADHYRDHPALVLWHISNEYGDHVSRCYCDKCAAGFRAWLTARYQEIGALNEAWGTAMWGQRYGSFAEVNPPRATMAPANPTHTLDYARFCTENINSLYVLEREVLTSVTPEIPATTNFMTVLTDIDYWKLAGELDFISFDNYPDPADPVGHLPAALNYGIMRSLAGRKPWLLLESAPSAVSWREHNVPKADGQNRAHAFQAVAHGSDAVMYFQWRASRVGAERFHSAIVGHLGEESRTLKETSQLWHELERLEAVTSSKVRSSVALVVDWESRWAMFGPETMPSNRLVWVEQLRAYQAVLASFGLAVDAVHPQSDFGQYDLVVAPNQFLLDSAAGARLSDYVQRGGHLVVGPFSAVVDEHNHVHEGGAPGPLRAALGVRVEEPWPVAPQAPMVVSGTDGYSAEVADWAEYLHCADGVEVVAQYSSGPLAARAAITRNAFGAGEATYISCVLSRESLAPVLQSALSRAGIECRPVPAAAVEVVTRTDGESDFTFVINHGEQPARVRIPSQRTLLLGAAGVVGDELTLAPFDVAVIQTDSSEPSLKHVQLVEVTQ